MRYLAWNNNLIAAAATTLVADNATTAHPVTNLKQQTLAQVYRSTDDTDINIEVDAGVGSKSYDLLSLAGHNINRAGTVTWTAGATPAFTGFQQSMDWRQFTMYTRLATPGTYRYHKIRVQNPTNTDGYVEIGLLWLGAAQTTPVQVAPEWEDAEIVLNREHETDVGVRHGELLSRQQVCEVLFSGLSTTEATTLWEGMVIESSGSELPIFIIPRDDEYRGWTMNIITHAKRRVNQYQEIVLRFIEAIRGVAVND